MLLTYFAHASFKLSTNGVDVIFDPYAPGAFNGMVGYSPINESADIVLVSHRHEDHNAVQEVQGNPKVIDMPFTGKEGPLSIESFVSFHDEKKGSERGENIVFIVRDDVSGITLAHLGDQGCVDRELAKRMQSVDVLLIPIGGTYTLSPETATEFINLLACPKLIVPMHYKTDKIGFPIQPLSAFLDLNQDKRQIKLGRPEVALEDYAGKDGDKNSILILPMARL